jgi:predicted alpha/beta hydrolase
MGERWPVMASDGHTFELLVEVPSQPDAVLFFVPAMGVEASYYGRFVEALGRQGILVAMCELRGHGTSSFRPARRVDFGYKEIVELDIPAALSVVRERSPAVPLYVGGHSLGGQLAMLHVAAAKPEIAGMAFVACAIPYYQNWHGRSRAWIRLATVVFPISGFVLGYVPGDRLGLGGKEARTLMRDWAHNARTARYELTGSDVDYESALAELPVELVTVNIAGDDLAPPNAVDFIFQKLPHAHGVRVEAKLSENKPGAHVRWARDADDVVRAVAGWIGERPAFNVDGSLKTRSRSGRGGG